MKLHNRLGGSSGVKVMAFFTSLACLCKTANCHVELMLTEAGLLMVLGSIMMFICFCFYSFQFWWKDISRTGYRQC
jgi:hypothetical protein